MELHSKRNDAMSLPTTPWEYVRQCHRSQDAYQFNRQQIARSPQYTNDAHQLPRQQTQTDRIGLCDLSDRFRASRSSDMRRDCSCLSMPILAIDATVLPHESNAPSAKFVQAVSKLSNVSTTHSAFSAAASVTTPVPAGKQSVKSRSSTQPQLLRVGGIRPAGNAGIVNHPSDQHKPTRRTRRCRVDNCEKYITNNGLCFSHGEDPSSASLMDATVEGKQEASVEHMAVERDAHCRYAYELLSQMAYAGHMEVEKGAPSKAAKKLRLSGPTTTAFTITAS